MDDHRSVNKTWCAQLVSPLSAGVRFGIIKRSLAVLLPSLWLLLATLPIYSNDILQHCVDRQTYNNYCTLLVVCCNQSQVHSSDLVMEASLGVWTSISFSPTSIASGFAQRCKQLWILPSTSQRCQRVDSLAGNGFWIAKKAFKVGMFLLKVGHVWPWGPSLSSFKIFKNWCKQR